MSTLDWIVLSLTLLFVVLYGIYRSREKHTMDSFLLAGQSMPWYHVTLSLMATQASAITFLSAPGQAYTDGMRFVQFYFGLPLAMVVLCVTFVPKFGKLKIFTAYEFLEGRFDLRTRALTAFLFLLQRGLSTGLSIYAPSLILSAILGWDITWTNIISGGVVILYTTLGGSRAVSHTHLQQMGIITIGMVVAGVMVVKFLPEQVSFTDALHVAGKMGKVNLIDFTFDLNNRYNVWSGLIGGFFLQLSYFGTDQSQVGRYLTARSVSESRLGLLMNGFVKVPMQFFILLLGVLVFTFYQFNPEPVFFNQSQLDLLGKSKYKDSLVLLERSYAETETLRIKSVAAPTSQQLQQIASAKEAYRSTIKRWLNDKEVGGDDNDTNYIFLRFVTDYLPKGLIGLLIAVIFLAAWGSIAATLNSLSSCTIVDFHRRFSLPLSQEKEFRLSRIYTFFWGVFCVAVAQLAYNLGNSLIEAVNVLGSLFYGVILGIFLVAFYRKKVGGTAVFISAIITEALVILLNVLSRKGIVPLSFLWFNLVGAVGVVLLSELIQRFLKKAPATAVSPD